MKSPLLFFFALLFPLFITAQNTDFWEPHAIGLLPKNYVVYNVTTLDENNIWAICWRQPDLGSLPLDHEIKILKTKNGGNDWEVLSMTDFPGYFSLDFQLMDENTAWMSVRDLGLTTATKIIKTEDGGATWQVKYEDEAAGLWARFFNENEGVAVNFPHVATTTDGGQTWQTDSLENISKDDDYNLSNNSCIVVNDIIWTGTPSGKVGKSIDKGKTWEFFDVGLGTAAQITAVAFKDEMNGMALGSSVITRFSVTNDGGKTWTPLGPTGFSRAYNLEYIPGTQGTFMACSAWGSPTVSAYTNDFGQNWTIATKGDSYGGVDFIAPNIGWAGNAWVEDESESTVLYKWVGSGLTNTQEQSILKTDVFPNPTSDVLTLQINEGQTPDFITIYNSLGQEVYALSNNAKNQIHIGFLPKGCYYLKYGQADKIYAATFVKK